MRLRFDVYQDRNGEWRWRLYATNGRILADSGESYKRVGACKKAINTIRNGALTAHLSGHGVPDVIITGGGHGKKARKA